MSLRVWLPLDGNLKNYGASETTVISYGSPTVNDSGKIGKCYYFDGSDDYINFGPQTINSSGEFSLTEWCYFSSAKTWCRPFELSNIDATGSTNKTCIGVGLGSNGLTFYKFAYFNGTANPADISVQSVSLDTWYHVAMTVSGTTVKVYVNGELKVTQTMTTSYAGITFPYCYIGKSTWTSDKYLNGKVNDFRFYDHCLSPDEVKEISKALVLYYPLNNTSIKTPNLIERMEAGGRTTLINNYAFDATFTSSDTYAWFDTYPALTLGKTYTLSFDVENLASGSAWTWCLWNNKNYPVAITKDGHYSYTFIPDESKLPSGYSLSRFLFDDAGKTNPTGTVRFKNFKIELGEKDTPFCTINEVPEIYDNSGYNRHGTVTSNTCPIAINESLRNNSCCQFDGTDDLIVAPVKQADILSDKKFTISAWVYLTEWTNYRGVFGPHDTGGVVKGIFFCQSDEQQVHCGFGNGSSWLRVRDSAFPLNTWVNYVMTYDGSKEIVYRNGDKVGEVSGSIAFDNENITVGRAHINSGSINRYWKGKISDFKIYATALSADDVSKEYHRYAAIYNNHSFAANEFIEDSKASVGINGVLKGNLIEGDYSKVSIIPSSGNIQATEFIEGI